MIDLINGFIIDLKNLALLAIGLAAIGVAMLTFVKTRSGAAVIGVLALGFVAIAVGANLEFLAGLLGAEINTRGGGTGGTGGEWGTGS